MTLGDLFLLIFLLVIKSLSSVASDDYNAAVTLFGGKFRMGSSTADRKRGELPVRTESVKPFVIDKYPVTNENFRKFVRAVKFKTEAERFGWSFVFHTFVPNEVRTKITQSVPVNYFALFRKLENRPVHAHECIMGNQGSMAGNSRVCLEIEAQLNCT